VLPDSDRRLGRPNLTGLQYRDSGWPAGHPGGSGSTARPGPGHHSRAAVLVADLSLIYAAAPQLDATRPAWARCDAQAGLVAGRARD
jgi:hypothetical protein